MAEVKWIKLQVGMFDGMSFKKIRRAKIGGESFRDKLTAVWFELMDFAGQCNHDGAFISPHEIPFRDLSDIAVMIDRDEDELNLCMQFFINEGMVTVVDDIYMLTNWEKYQSAEKLADIREYNRLAQQKSRAKRKLVDGVNDMSMTCQPCQGTDIDIDIEKDIEIELEKGYRASPAEPTKPSATQKHKYGEYKNVLLTDEEYEKLKDEFPNDYEERIERLSSYIASKGAKYKNHLATIRNWARKNKPETNVGANGIAISSKKSAFDDIF